MIKKKKGFTLVELIVVIAIIAILAAITVPTTMHYVEKANISKELQQMNISNVLQNKFVDSNNVTFDLSETTNITDDKFSQQFNQNELPYTYLGKIEITVDGNGDNWTVSFVLKGQEYGDVANGSILNATLLNTYNNKQIFKGSTSIPSSKTTYIYVINKENGTVTLQ